MEIEIKNRYTCEVIYRHDCEDNTIAKTVMAAIAAGVSLCGADLRGADLRDADLRDANFCDADLRDAKGLYMACPTDGAFVAWKRAGDHIVKLRVADDARRSSATCNKCRCDKAEVLEIQNEDGTPSGLEAVHSDRDESFVYVVGATVEVPDFDENRFNECTTGIHFFVDRRAAVEYKQ